MLLLAVSTLLQFLPMPIPRPFARLVRSIPAVLAAALLSAQASCGDPSSGPLSDARARQGGGSVAQDSTLLVSLRDTVLTVGMTSTAQVTDPEFVASGRLRFLALPVVWHSSDTTIAVIDNQGNISARSEGMVYLTATWGNRVGVRSLRVRITTAPDPEEPQPPTPEPPAPPRPPETEPPPAGLPTMPAGSPAELPRAYVEYPTSDGNGRVIRVTRSGLVQTAIDSALPGDVILLEAGATFREAIVLRRKTGTDWITIRTEGQPTTPGIRVALDDTLRFARIASASGSPTVSTEAGASGYRLVNLHLAVDPSRTMQNTLVTIGDGGSAQNTLDKVPRRIVIDRSIVRGRPDLTLRRCIALHSAESAIANSLILECHEKGADSQGIAGWNGPGPYLIENNQIEGAGQNILFGGAHPAIAQLHPADMVIRFNHIRKPGHWHVSGRWSIKNNIQFKHAQRVLIYHNLIDGNWVDAQTGGAIAFSSTNQGGGPTTWAETRDISFFENVVRNAGRGMIVSALGSGVDGNAVRGTRFLLAGNVLYRLGDLSPYGGRGDPLAVMSGVAHVMIVENTFDGGYNTFAIPDDGNPPRLTGFTFDRNVASFNSYGVSGAGLGINTLQVRYSTFSFTSNCFYRVLARERAPASAYPAPNVVSEESSNVTMPGLVNGDPTIGAGSACSAISLAAGQRLGGRRDLVRMLEEWIVPGRRP